jgi:hypothetical protein
MKKFLCYLLRWQLSTPILWAVIYFMHLPSIEETVIANLVGGILFFWIDKKIFTKNFEKEVSRK